MEKLRIGIFGLWRGMEYLRQFSARPDTEVTAVCDSNPKRIEEALAVKPGVRVCEDFDGLLDSGIDAVVLCNFFHEHAPYAIRAMEHGVDVLSECTAAATMGDCVRLYEAVQRTGRRYMLAENYPFTTTMQEITRLCQEGTLGRILYAEGEYNHSGPREMLKELTPEPNHWRAWLPRTYYATHALGPLMFATGQTPVQVSAFAVHSYVLEEYDDFRHNYDALAMMNCITDDGALFRFTGCTAMGSKSGYRIVGEFGSCETGRALGGDVYLNYQPWTIPEGRSEKQIYTPNLPDHTAHGGHGGGDYVVAENFADYVLRDKTPFFDVNRACAMSATSILAWRSCLENGKVYPVPDFSREEERNRYRDDFLTPFPDAEGKVTLPCALPKH